MRTTMNRLAIALLVLFGGAFPGISGESGPWSERFVKVGDIKVRYLEAGAGDRILVFVPGWMMSAEIWKEQIPYFSSRGFRVIALDPRSQGGTTRTESGNTYQQHAADLHAFFQSLKIEHCNLVGWAAGVTTLLEYLSSPEVLKPDKVVFVEGGPAATKIEDYPGAGTLQQARKFLMDFEEDRDKAVDQHIRSLFKSRQPEILYRDLFEGSKRMPPGAVFSLYFDLYTGDRRSTLRHVTIPCLIVTSTQNRAVAEYMQDRIPRSSLEILEDAGSALFLDKPQAFNQMLEAFLGEH